MIFQSLISLYDRLAETSDVPSYGFSVEDIGFCITVDEEGKLIGDPEDLRIPINSNLFEYFLSEVPYTNEVNVRSSGAAQTPNFMVDKANYIFGMSGSAEKNEHHESFIKLISKVCENSNDDGIVAVKAFLSKWNPSDSPSLKGWKDMSGEKGKWIAFKLRDDSCFVHERREVKKLWSKYLSTIQFPIGISFVDGQVHDLQTQYAQFKFGSGASLVSFNEAAYESYRKQKGENAPISVEAEFKSSTALKFLLRSKTQRLKIGDAITVFWAQKKSPIETFMGHVLDPSVEDAEAIVSIQKFLEAIREGKMPSEMEKDKDIHFYILGFSLNKARLALRDWYVSRVGDLIARIGDHFTCLKMEQKRSNDLLYPGVWHLLKETARDTKDISPVLGGALMRSILTGANYPQNLFQGVLGRIRADQAKKDQRTGKPVENINFLRASILKAFLQRNHKMEIPMSLNIERTDVPYLLGRLFAVLEKAQLDALGGVNATIKDRFYSAASATPASVFPRLLRLSQHHIAKADYGYVSDERIRDILEHIDSFPNHMNLKEQGLFAIAYYHQKNSFFKK